MSSGKNSKPLHHEPKQGNTHSFADIAHDNNMSIVITLSIIGFTVFLFLILTVFRRGKKRRSILICGPSDSGKTLLFSQLVHGKQIDTYTSMQENFGILDLAESRKKPVDVLDASTITKGIRDATEFLFKILSDPDIHSNKTPVLIVCNKQDLTLAKGSTVIERELAKEIGLLRETQSRTLQGTDGNVADHVFLGKVGKDFAFSDLRAKVDFCEVSALQDDNTDKINDWISDTA